MPGIRNHKKTDQPNREHPILRGITMAMPIVMGYLAVGFAYGVLGRKAGLPLVHILLMSLIVYAGSAQLIGVGLFAAGIQPLSIVLTTFIVNIRHMLMSAALAPYVEKWSKGEKVAFGLELTDETFALHSTHLPGEKLEKTTIFSINITSQTAWVLGSLLGALLGGQIGDIYSLGLDFALPAMFIALLVMQLKSRTHGLVALCAGLLSLGLYLSGIQQWYVLIAASLAAGWGVALCKPERK